MKSEKPLDEQLDQDIETKRGLLKRKHQYLSIKNPHQFIVLGPPFLVYKKENEESELLTKCAEEVAWHDVNSGKVTLDPENAEFRLSDFIPMSKSFNRRNWHNYWCNPELRRELTNKRGILNLHNGGLLAYAILNLYWGVLSRFF